MWRNIGFLVFQFLIPVIQVTVFCLAIGRNPNQVRFQILIELQKKLFLQFLFNLQLNIAIVNGELPFESSCHHYTNGCLMGDHDEFLV